MQGALLVTQAVKNYKKRNIGREERRKEERGRVDADADVLCLLENSSTNAIQAYSFE